MGLPGARLLSLCPACVAGLISALAGPCLLKAPVMSDLKDGHIRAGNNTEDTRQLVRRTPDKPKPYLTPVLAAVGTNNPCAMAK